MLRALLFAGILCTGGPARLYAQQPQLFVTLPEELREISGLTVRGEELLAVEDESGKYYPISIIDGMVGEPVEFWKDGDYEGIELVDQDVWVVKSSGTLYQITGAGTQVQRVEKYNTWLTGDNNVEGLAYDAAHNRLLLACKTDADDDGRSKDNRYVFAFDLDRKVLGERALYTIPCKEYHEFSPSALAIQPGTGNLYLTSSVNNQLMVLDPMGEVLETYRFDKDLLPQPEGLAFTPEGTLYISTEARGGQPARIYTLPLRP